MVIERDLTVFKRPFDLSRHLENTARRNGSLLCCLIAMHSTPTLILGGSASWRLHKHMTSEKDLRLQALMAKCWKQANLCSSLCYEGEKEFNIPRIYSICRLWISWQLRSNARSFCCLWRNASIAILKLPFLSHRVLFDSHVSLIWEQQLPQLTLFTDQTNLTCFRILPSPVSLLFAQCLVC